MRAERTAHSHPAPRAGETDETGLYVGKLNLDAPMLFAGGFSRLFRRGEARRPGACSPAIIRRVVLLLPAAPLLHAFDAVAHRLGEKKALLRRQLLNDLHGDERAAVDHVV